MDYQLLKRLKDSGFPLRRVTVEPGREISLERPAVVFMAEVGIYYVPSLSELVDACGQYLRDMFRVDDGWGCNQRERPARDQPSAETRGATLDDALAELWLTHAGSSA